MSSSSSEGKPSLPYGWMVVPSRSHPDRVYYFNTITGSSSWEDPISLLKNLNKRRTEKETLQKVYDQIKPIEKKYDSASDESECATLTTPPEKPSSVSQSSVHSHEGSCRRHWLSNSANIRVETHNRPQLQCSSIQRESALREKLLGPSVVGSSADVAYEEPPIVQNDDDQDDGQIGNGPIAKIKKNQTKEFAQQRLQKLREQLAKNASAHASNTCSKERDVPPVQSINKKRPLDSVTEECGSECLPPTKKISSSGKGEWPLQKMNSALGLVVSSDALGRKVKFKVPGTEEAASSSSSTPSGPSHSSSTHPDDSAYSKISHLGKEIITSQMTSPNIHEIRGNLSSPETNKAANGKNVNEETMEWETLDDEKVLSDIKQLRSEIYQNGVMSPLRSELSMNNMEFVCQQSEWFIVLDTNVLLSHLGYVEELRDTDFQKLGYPVLVIPWIVLEELDVLKNRRGHKINLEIKARKAVAFIHSNFNSHHPRVKGQGIVNACNKKFTCEVPDDQILHCCMQIAETGNIVFLLSNDKNLCNKTFVNGIPAYSVDKMRKEPPDIPSKIRGSVSNALPVNDSAAMGQSSENPALDNHPVTEASTADSCLCQLKTLLKSVLSHVLETEMEKAYDEDWKKIIAVKPPWVLSDVIFCILKHWTAVFYMVLPRSAQENLKTLKRFLDKGVQSKGYGYSLNDMKIMMETSLDLCLGIPSKVYGDIISPYIQQIEKLTQSCHESQFMFQEAKEIHEKKKLEPPKNDSMGGDKKMVFSILSSMWSFISFHCGMISDALNLEHKVSYTRPSQLPDRQLCRKMLRELFPCVKELVNVLNMLLETPADRVQIGQGLIEELYRIIITDNPHRNEPEEPLTLENVQEFCSDKYYRVLLVTGLKQFELCLEVLGDALNYFMDLDGNTLSTT